MTNRHAEDNQFNETPQDTPQDTPQGMREDTPQDTPQQSLPEKVEGKEESSEAKVPQEKDKGVILRNAREAQGLTLETVHEATKIPMDALRAIEEGYSIRHLTSFYYDGFVKMYARYLDVDISEILKPAKSTKIPRHEKIEIEENVLVTWLASVFTRQRKQQIVIGAGALLLCFVTIKGLSCAARGLFGGSGSKPSSKAAGAVKKDAKEFKTPKKVKVVKPTGTSVVAVPAATVTAKPVPRTPPASSSTPDRATSSSPTSSRSNVPAVRKNISLTVRAQKNSWLRVVADGEVVFQSTLRLGSVETWLANEKIEISGKNINQLEFELNGKMIGALGRKERRVKQIEVTKDGFTVIQ